MHLLHRRVTLRNAFSAAFGAAEINRNTIYSSSVEPRDRLPRVRKRILSLRRGRLWGPSDAEQERSPLVRPTGPTLYCPPSILQGHDIK
jgi:hypothetical protein